MTEPKITKDAFVDILREIGLSETQMTQLHEKLEARFPQDHARLLEWLGFDEKGADALRAKFR